jgi:uncharacterized protein (DUF427 family)
MKAIRNNTILAESDTTIVLESHHYFPTDSVKKEYLSKSGARYTCPWKGTCDYYAVTVKDKSIKDAAWVYPEPQEAARQIAGYYAFWKDVEIKE